MPHNLKNKLLNTHIVDPIGTFYFYENFMVSEINEGVILDIDIVVKMTNQYTKKYYAKHKSFVFITNRVNSYSFNPTIHFETKKMLPNVKGYAIVTYNSINARVAKLEKNFLDIPTRVFNNLQDAAKWADELVPKNQKV